MGTPLQSVIEEFTTADQATIAQRAESMAAEMSQPSLKELVGGGQRVHFVMYRKGELHYRTDSGFDFVVPAEDCGDASFLADDKAMLFMRYIRVQLATNEAGREAAGT